MKSTLKLTALAYCLFLFGCSSETSNEKTNQLLNKPAEVNVQFSEEVLDDMMQSLPQPIEIAQIISSSKIDISKNVLIPTDNSDKYKDKYIQSLAFGAYGVDLGYINLNNKVLYVVDYLQEIKNLSEKLKVSQFFDFQTMAQLAKNRNSTDSLVRISTENFNRIDKFLKEQNRGELSVLMLIGAWMEGMNMFCEIYKSTHSADIAKRIAEQKIVFDNIFLLLDKLNKIDYFQKLQSSFTPTRKVYDKITITYKYNKPKMTEVNGQLVLKDQTTMDVVYTDEDVKEIITELQRLRINYFIL